MMNEEEEEQEEGGGVPRNKLDIVDVIQRWYPLDPLENRGSLKAAVKRDPHFVYFLTGGVGWWRRRRQRWGKRGNGCEHLRTESPAVPGYPLLHRPGQSCAA